MVDADKITLNAFEKTGLRGAVPSPLGLLGAGKQKQVQIGLEHILKCDWPDETKRTFRLTIASIGEAEEKMLEYDASTPEGAEKIVSKINSILRTRFAEGSRRVSRDIGLTTPGRSAGPAPSTGSRIQRRLSGMLRRSSSSAAL